MTWSVVTIFYISLKYWNKFYNKTFIISFVNQRKIKNFTVLSNILGVIINLKYLYKTKQMINLLDGYLRILM